VVEQIPSHCAYCQGPLPQGMTETDPAPQRHQVTELPTIVCTTTEYRLHARTCPACARRTWAQLPEGVPRVWVGPRLQAFCALLTGRYHLSRRAAKEFLQELFGEELSLGSLCALEAQTSAALEAPYQQVAEAVAASPAVNVDETRWQQGKQRAWLWLAATGQLARFRIDPSRSRAAFEALLPPDPGRRENGSSVERTVTSDRWSAYTHLSGEAWQICWAHLARDFQGLADRRGKARPIGEAALAEVRSLFGLWHQFRRGEIERAMLQEALQPVQERLRQVLEAADRSGHYEAGGLARNLLQHWESLWTFTRREGVEPTNNHAERALRRGVLWRKNSFGNQSAGGRAFVERLLTVVGSLRLQGRGVLEYLEAACRAALLGVPAPSLLPNPAG
jgi:transposase